MAALFQAPQPFCDSTPARQETGPRLSLRPPPEMIFLLSARERVFSIESAWKIYFCLPAKFSLPRLPRDFLLSVFVSMEII